MLTQYTYLKAAALTGANGDTLSALPDSSGNSRAATVTNGTLSVSGGLRGVHLSGSGVLDLGADPGGLNALCRDGDYTVVVAFAPDAIPESPVDAIATDATLFAKNAATNNNQTWLVQGAYRSNSGQFSFGYVGRYGLDKHNTGQIQAGDKVVLARRVRRLDSTHLEETVFLNGRRWSKNVVDTAADGLTWADSAHFTFGGLAGGSAGYTGTLYAGMIASGGTDADVIALMETVRSEAGLPSFPVYTDPEVQIIWIGNSLFHSIGVALSQRWYRQTNVLLAAATGGNYCTIGWGIGGARWSADAGRPDVDVSAMYTRMVKPLLAPDRKTFLLCYEDTNQMDSGQAGNTPAESQAFAAALYAAARADLTASGDRGKVYRLTCIANNSDPAGTVNTLNSLRRAADSNATLIDVAAVAELSDPANSTYFIDGTHLQPAGYGKAAVPVAGRLALDIVPSAPLTTAPVLHLGGGAAGVTVSLTTPVAGASGYDLEADGAVTVGVSFPVSVVLGNLATSHRFRARATNGVGAGPWSSPVFLGGVSPDGGNGGGGSAVLGLTLAGRRPARLSATGKGTRR